MNYEPKPGTPIEALDTPILLLDLAALEANIARMAGFFANRPARLRPHSKTHKCPQIAHRQLAAGAIGITCAKVSEAEVMARAGVADILIANQVTGPVKIDRLTDLARGCDLMVAVDDPANVAALSQACCEKGVSLRVLIEVDVGMGRCGVPAGAAAVALAHRVAASRGLRFAGLMGYEGHLVLTANPVERDTRVRQALTPLRETAELLADAGLPAEIISSGGTGTYTTTGDFPPVTEVQAGSYVFMDSTYLPIRPEFRPALTLLSTVVSRPTPGGLVLDAGLKSITREFGLPELWPLHGDAAFAGGVKMRYLSEEHAVLDVTEPDLVALRPGDRARFLPSHCCTTVNLHDNLYVVQGGRLADIWPVAGRGCSR